MTQTKTRSSRKKEPQDQWIPNSPKYPHLRGKTSEEREYISGLLILMIESRYLPSGVITTHDECLYNADFRYFQELDASGKNTALETLFNKLMQVNK